MQQELRLQWLFGALQGVAATAAAVVLLWAMLPAVYPPDAPAASDAALVLPGREFAAVVAARAAAEGDSMVVQAMQPAERGEQQIGEAVWRLEQPGLSADDLAQLRLELEGVQPGQEVVLFWRSALAPEQLHYAELGHGPAGVSWLNLGQLDTWQGQLLELAVGVFGEPGPEPLRLRELDFGGYNRYDAAQRVFAEWRRFQPWQQSSANWYAGVPGAALIRPAAAAGLWAAVALVLVLGWHLWRRGPRGTLVVAGLWALLIPWLALDYLWQVQLERQLQETRAQFGALSQAEKHERAIDADLQRYALHLQQILQPLRHQRLFLLHEANQGHNFTRLRLQFRLLPLNIYNYGNTLVAPEHLRPSDLVLLLKPVAGVRYDPARGLLDDGAQQVAATLLDTHPLGSLYRIAEPGHAQ
ncbi:hypothetical protein Q6D67_12060 [Haliea sp. E1-2-M8]|uniref:hypothetical protein n=1 Tax=Haliea sp. E1-2-M8 TaxID=3064706 RepID=UPI002716E99A|nr:hypothetical protein [Haliea sp. E1-2-M8]MDO8862435.1 hypothetical protein [Haliea sp. E1-2-M8]